MPITVRGSRITFFNAQSIEFTLPAGSAAGDTCVIFAAQINAPAILNDRWDLLNTLSSINNPSGATYFRQLDAADISLGTVTFGFASAAAGVICGVTYVGNVTLRSAGQFNRNSTGAATTTLTEAAATNTDHVLYFGFNRANNSVTSSRGASLQTTSNTNASASVYGELLAATGSITNTYSFSGTPGGYYVALVTVKADPGTTSVRANQTVRLVGLAGSGTARFHQVARQVLISKDPAASPIRLHQSVRLVLLAPAAVHPIVYFYETARQVLLKNNGAVQFRQLARLVLLGTVARTRAHCHTSIIW